jgi:uncharacterized Ntn-hydrolase superfamily protein
MTRHGTYSIVARDPDTLELGVAVQSHWFSVGSAVPFLQPGVGAVAVQAVPDPHAGADVLDAMARGEGARDALRRTVAGTDAGMRQVGIVSARGTTAAWTGAGCIPFAGDVEGPGFSVQANMMLRAGVPEAMAAGFTAAQGPLAERLLAALEAGEGAGGDVRGRQSAALMVAPAQGVRTLRSVDLRVEDHGDPLGELRRLLVLHRAYELAGQADELVAQHRARDAAPLYEAAAELAPGSDELLFWAGLAAGAPDGLDRVRTAIDLNPRWAELLDRLTAEVAPTAQAVRDALKA